MKIAILPGDGIGTEIVAQAVRVMQCLDLLVETPGRAVQEVTVRGEIEAHR